MINEDYTRGALAVTAGKGLANKLGNAQERRHLELKESSHFPENIPKLYLVNHKLFTDYIFFLFFYSVQLDMFNSMEERPMQIKATGAIAGKCQVLHAS